MRFCSARWGCPSVRYPDGTEVQPHLDFRERFDLYAGVRPFRLFKGAPTPLADPRAKDIDCVLVRESTEGLFASRTMTRREGNDAVFDTMRITRRTSERLFAFAFELARSRSRARNGRPGRVTCVDKANVIPSMAFFRSIFLEMRVAASRHRVRLRLCGCGRSQDGAGAVGIRRARHREHVRRHPVGCGGRASSEEWAWRRLPISATPMACSSRVTGRRPTSPVAASPIRRP